MLVTELSFSCLLLIVVKASSDVLVAVVVTTPATFVETEARSSETLYFLLDYVASHLRI